MRGAKYTAFITFVIICCMSYVSGQQPEWQKKYDNPQVLRGMFAEPPMFYAPHFFWFWDDTLRNEQFAASMAIEITKQRINPGYVHPRSSMNREDTNLPSLPVEQYLEKPWFNSFRQALDKSSALGFTLGYCDDYDWPSGQAAGKVLQSRPDLKAQHLSWKRRELQAGESVVFDSVDFVVAGKLINGSLDAKTLQILGENTVQWRVPDGQWVAYTYTKEFHAGADGGRVNYLHQDLMKTFIPLVHEKYQKEFDKKMGNSIPGVFVDHEGDYGWHIAWSDYLAQYYKDNKSRDIRLWLPLLTEKDHDGIYVKARNDWFDMVSEAYINCFFEPLVDWLGNRNMYAISNLWEESLQTQTSMVGDLMRITRQIPMPGNDCLLMKSQKVHDFKEVQSVAEFEDRPFMSEIMGVAGWDQSPEMMKMTVNSITSFGVSHIVPHGINLNRSLGTIPFPADWYTENPYWPYLHQWADFSRRASFVTRQTKLVADVLLFHPLESIWGEAEGMFDHPEGTFNDNNPEVWSETAQSINRVYSETMEQLSTNNIDFLVGDKHYIEQAQLSEENNQKKLDILGHKFSTLVLPPLSVLSQSTSKKILRFGQEGGLIIFLGQLPTGSPEIGKTDSIIMSDMESLRNLPNVVDLSAYLNDPEKLVQEIRNRRPSRMKFSDTGRLYTMHRSLGNTNYYWLANNTDSVKHFDAWFKDGEGAAEIWNCETGQVVPIYYSVENGIKKTNLTLQPFEAYWLVFNPNKEPIHQPQTKQKSTVTEKIADYWTISYPKNDTVYRSSANVWHGLPSTINYDAMKVLISKSSGVKSSFIKGSVEQLITKHDGIERIPYTAVSDQESWWEMVIPIGAKTIIFPTEMIGKKVWINGKPKKISNPNLRISKDAKYLVFSLGNSHPLPSNPIGFELGESKTAGTLASWYDFGLDQYTGYLDYETSINIQHDSDKTVIDLGKVKYMAEVYVNGKSVGARLWPPYRFDLSNELKKGDNTIKIRVGNLMVNHMALMDDMHQLRTWSWGFSPEPNLDHFDSGLRGPVILEKREKIKQTDKHAKVATDEN